MQVLIIGGGVVGLSLAYELACHNVGCQVLDRADLGREASWAGAGILPPASEATALFATICCAG
jgi:glycine oxidase